jgi:hypothetical protein
VSFTASPDRQCQFCFKPVHPQATKCPYCQSNLPPAAVQPSPPIYKPQPWTRKDRFVLWGVGSLLAVCVVGAIIVNHGGSPPVYKPSIGTVVFLNEGIIRRMESGADAESLIQVGVAFRIAPSDIVRVIGKVGDGPSRASKGPGSRWPARGQGWAGHFSVGTLWAWFVSMNPFESVPTDSGDVRATADLKVGALIKRACLWARTESDILIDDRRCALNRGRYGH